MCKPLCVLGHTKTRLAPVTIEVWSLLIKGFLLSLSSTHVKCMHVAAGSRALVLEGYLGCDGGQGFRCSIMEARRLDQTINDNAWEHRDIDKAHLLTASRTTGTKGWGKGMLRHAACPAPRSHQGLLGCNANTHMASPNRPATSHPDTLASNSAKKPSKDSTVDTTGSW